MSRTAVLWSMLVLGLCGTAHAQEIKEARSLAEAGAQNYKLGDYQSALDSFTQAYKLHPSPKLLFNIGQCHKYLKNYERAIWAFESFLSENPSASDRTFVQELITKLKVEQADAKVREEEARRIAEETRRTDALAQAEAARKEAEQRRAAEAALKAKVARLEEERRLAALAKARAQQEPPLYKRWWFWTILGGAALAAGGVALGVSVSPETQTILPMGGLGVGDHR